MTDPFFSRPMRLVSRTQETPDTWTLAFEPLDGMHERSTYHYRHAPSEGLGIHLAYA